MIYAFFLFVFVQKSFLTKNYFLTAEINLTTRGPLYTCLIESQFDFFQIQNIGRIQKYVHKRFFNDFQSERDLFFCPIIWGKSIDSFIKAAWDIK